MLHFSYKFQGLTLAKGRPSPEEPCLFSACVRFGPGTHVQKDIEAEVFCPPDQAVKTSHAVEILGSLRQITVITKANDNSPEDPKRPAVVAISDAVSGTFYAAEITPEEKEQVLQFLQAEMNLARFVQ